jgi:asparagine synthase (glutamine-hydrolysing)
MCGVAGIFAYRPAAPSPDSAELRRIRDRMAARGPDGLGEWSSPDGRLILGHRRLSIIDLSERGAQPMASADGRHLVSFNGEIYNYRELRAGLEAKGRRFRSDSDTEVLLHLYAEYGEGMVERLRGMFAFGLWDAERRALLLARDAFGIKPLYYADDGRTLRFASQVKALLAGGAISREPDPAGEAGFWLLGSVPEPYTLYRGIRALEAGCSLWVDEQGVRPQRWFSLSRTLRERRQAVQGKGAGDNEVRSALLDSVRAHLVADVPVGAFLSAGIDSGALLGLMRDAGQTGVHTITLAFEEFRGTPEDEAPLAEQVARRYGARHSTRYVTQREFEADLPRILEAMDQPSIDGLNTWFVSKAAAEQGLKVAVSGLGGDELLGGYPAFRDLPRWVRLFRRLPSGLGRLARRIGQALPIHPKLLALPEYAQTYPGAWLVRRGLFMPWELPGRMGTERAAEGLVRLAPLEHLGAVLGDEPLEQFDRVAALETALYMRNQLLRDTDWASMAHSLEVRVPLVDLELLRRIAPRQPGKQALAASPTLALPPEIAQRAKTGFRTPIDRWMGRRVGAQGHWSRRWAVEVMAATEIGTGSG